MAAVDKASTSSDQALLTEEPEPRADSGRPHPKHQIFLSYSGADKKFVWHLCEHLERVHHYPFFDVRDDSLPKGENPQLIFQAAQQCQLAILVISENFFRSKRAMLELAFFVEARQFNNPHLKILPLFYGLTVAQFREPARQDRWFKEWEKLADSDASERIETSKWKAALKVVGVASNGLEFVDGQSEVVYIKKIVATACKLVPIHMRWNESHIQGQRHLHNAVRKMFEESVPSLKVGCRVIGLYGVGGTGKTTLCKTLCNGFFPDFAGKVCHLEVSCKIKTPIETQKEVLHALTGASKELLRAVTDFDKGQSLYVERIGKQKVFLTLDNVWDSGEALTEAAAYLEAKFSADSKILVTARSLNTLLKLGINRDSCFEMPHLEEDDALALFLHYAQPGRSLSDFKDPDELRVLTRCVRCVLCGKGVASNRTSERHFHPLALKILGLHFATTSPFPLGWIEKLAQFDLKRFGEIGDPIFSILRTSYDALPAKRLRSMFLDAAIYAPRKPDNTVPTVKQLCKWLSIVYEENFEDVLARLEVLSSRALLDQWNNLSEAVSIHDLYREFAEIELRGGDNEDHLRLLHQGVDTEPKLLRKNPVQGNCSLFERICIQDVGVESFDKAKLLRCSNLEVLKLDFCYALRTLDLQGLNNLRSLELYGCFDLTHLLHLWELENLIWMRWNTCNLLRPDLVFPTSLEILELFGVSKSDSSVMEPPDIQGCKFLRELTLKNFPELKHFPQLSGLKLLLKVDFGGCTKVKSLIFDDQCYLRKLNLQNCKSLKILCLPPSCATLMKLRCRGCESLVEIRNITDCRKLRVLELEGCGKLMYQPANTLNTLTGPLSTISYTLSSEFTLWLADHGDGVLLQRMREDCSLLLNHNVFKPPFFRMVGWEGLTIGFLLKLLKAGVPLADQVSALEALSNFSRSVVKGPWESIVSESGLVDHLLMLLKSETHVHCKNHVADLLSKLCWIEVVTPDSGPITSEEKSGFPSVSPEAETIQCALDTINLQALAGKLHHIVTVIDALCMDENLGSLSFVIAAIAGFEESNRAICLSQSGPIKAPERSNYLTRALREDRSLLQEGVVKVMTRRIMKHFSDKLNDSPRSVLFALDALASNIHIQEELLLQDAGRLVSRTRLTFKRPRLTLPLILYPGGYWNWDGYSWNWLENSSTKSPSCS